VICLSILKKTAKDASKVAGILLGNAASLNVQNATDATIRGMDLFRSVAVNKQNVDFALAKGNLFEYIESTKFNQNASTAGSDLRAVVTDSVGRPHDPADIEILKNEKVVRQVQAKFSDSEHAAKERFSKYAKKRQICRNATSNSERRTLHRFRHWGRHYIIEKC